MSPPTDALPYDAAHAAPYAADGGEVGALVCHGFTSSPGSVRDWAEHLAAAGLTVRVPLLPGHGTSWRDANTTAWPDWYAAVADAFDELRERCSTVLTMGLSLGGTLALRVAEERPAEVAGVVVVNPHFVNTRWDARLVLPWARFVVPSRPGLGNDLKREGVREPAYDRTPLKAAWQAVRFGALVRRDLGRITAPVLLFGSRTDHVVDPVNQRILREETTATTVEQVVLHDSYHVATMDNDAPLVFDGSLRFAQAQAAARSGT